jgi:hypothetical protein
LSCPALNWSLRLFLPTRLGARGGRCGFGSEVFFERADQIVKTIRHRLKKNFIIDAAQSATDLLDDFGFRLRLTRTDSGQRHDLSRPTRLLLLAAYRAAHTHRPRSIAFGEGSGCCFCPLFDRVAQCFTPAQACVVSQRAPFLANAPTNSLKILPADRSRPKILHSSNE